MTVVAATGLSWYSERVAITANGLVDQSSTGLTLWHVRNLAAWLLVAAAVVGFFALLHPRSEEWRGGMVAAVCGFGISVYCLAAMFALPDLGSVALVGGFLGVAVSTALDIGPFLALLGGLMADAERTHRPDERATRDDARPAGSAGGAT